MRVATRRMRAAWRVFDGAYGQAQRRYVKELRVVAARLGRGARPGRPARAAGRTTSTASREATRPNFEPLVAEWHKRATARAVN